MAIPLYLAQTAAEFASISPKPDHLAWMACHFSAYGTSLTNLPRHLPQKSLLILNDRTPVQGHDPEAVCKALMDTVKRLDCSGILLDFQHQGCEAIVTKAVTLPCPVAVTESYAQGLDCPVFLSAPPLNKPLSDYIKPWKGRQIWLEAALGCEEITVTENGSQMSELDFHQTGSFPFIDEKLHCKYSTEIEKDCIRFTLCRGKEELTALLNEAESLSIAIAVGLYQELGR